MPIKFGSDGWRGIIGQEFTLDNVARIAAAVCEWWPEDSGQFSGEVFIGYDNRELSREAAVHAWRVFKTLGKLRPRLSLIPCPSPYISWATHEFERPLSLQITASHNPPNYNGIKLKGKYGGSLLAESVKQIEALANQATPIPPSALIPEPADFGSEYFDADPDYESSILRMSIGTTWRVRPGTRRYPVNSGLKKERLIIDHMHGATSVYAAVLNQAHTIVERLRPDRDPTFGGTKPEPLEPLLPELIQRVRDANDGTVGLAFDGDGDRLAVIDETGQYLQSHEIFALLLDYLAGQTRDGRRVYPGTKVVTTVSFSSLLGRIARSYGLDVIEVPVGFKHISAEMLKGGVLIGGEESGGAALGHYLPERDALLMALTLLRAKGEAGATLHEMLRGIYARFGRTEFVHTDVQLDPSSVAAAASRRDGRQPAAPTGDELRQRIAALMEVERVCGEPVTARSDADGVKLCTADGWVLVRASGTEPLARFYAEAATKDHARRMIADVQARVI